MCWFTDARRRIRSRAGQASVEAAFLLPVFFVLLLMLLQPGIVLYDRMVMQAAAGDACRMSVTSGSTVPTERCEDLVLRHLGAIPQQELFHVHDGGCSYEIVLTGDEESQSVRATITNRIRVLPLVDVAGTLLGIVDDGGYMTIEVTAEEQSQPDWVASNPLGMDPSAWVGARQP